MAEEGATEDEAVAACPSRESGPSKLHMHQRLPQLSAEWLREAEDPGFGNDEHG